MTIKDDEESQGLWRYNFIGWEKSGSSKTNT